MNKILILFLGLIMLGLVQSASAYYYNGRSSSAIAVSDEFDGSTVNSSKWTAINNCADQRNNEQECYMASAVTVNGGNLILTGTHTSNRGFSYTSGAIESKTKPGYGRFEWRAQQPQGGQGLWPALWLRGDTPPEIDMLESVNNMDTIYMNYWTAGPTQHSSSYTSSTLATGFHIYTLEWNSSVANYYIDGVLRKTYSNGGYPAAKTLTVYMNLALGGNWPGNVGGSTPFPQTFVIDYFRYYDTTSTSIPTPTPTITPTPTSTPTATPTPTTQAPYGGIKWSIPGTVQAENFDKGGEGIAYHDIDISNIGGQYRPNEGVDIQATTDTGAGYNVGWIVAGELLVYSANVQSSGTYNLEIRVASNGNGGTFHIESNGVDKTGLIIIPNTGGWQKWQTISKTVSLNSGSNNIKIVMDTNGPNGYVGNINFMKLTLSTVPT